MAESLVKLRKIDDGYDVLGPDGLLLGFVHRAPDQAWSYAPWVIEGIYATVKGGVNGSQERRKGWPTRAAAVREIAILNSAAICAAIA